MPLLVGFFLQFCSVFFRLILPGLFLLFSLGVQGGTYYPFPRDDRFKPAGDWKNMKSVLDLSGYWTDDQGKEWRVPFWESGSGHLALSYSFRLRPDSAPYYLCFEGLAWKAAIYLNGRLLIQHDRPFEGVMIPLKPEWLHERGNILRVELETEGTFVAPGLEKGMGIHREVWILTPADSVTQRITLPTAYTADSVVIYTPYTAQHFYNVSRERLQSDLEDMEYAGVKVVYFPMEPSTQVVQAFRDAGYARILSLSGVKKTAWFNAFPHSREVYFREDVFWHTAEGRPTAAFGKWFSLREMAECTRSRDNLYGLFLFLIPMLGLVLFRIVSPHWFVHQFRWLYTRRLEMEMIFNRKFLRPVENSLLTLARIAITSSSIAAFIYYLQINCRVNTLTFPFDADSWIYYLVLSDWSPVFLWLIIFLGEMAYLMIRLSFIAVMNAIFRIPWFQRTYLDISLLSAFPLAMILPALGLYLLYAPAGQQAWLEPLVPVVGIIYFGRFWIMLGMGIYQRYRFTPILIFLYICTFEILPWLLVF